MTESEQKNNDVERIIVDLKSQLQEAKKVENNLEHEFKKREKELEKFKAKLILLGKNTNEESLQSKFKSSSKTLDDILSFQRSSSNKNGLGYEKENKEKQSSFINKEENKRSYVNALMRPFVKEYNKKNSLSQNESRTDNVPSRHQQLFLGNCYAYNNFGHIARNCKLMVPIGKGITSQSHVNKKEVIRSNPKGRNYNYFAPLQSLVQNVTNVVINDTLLEIVNQ